MEDLELARCIEGAEVDRVDDHPEIDCCLEQPEEGHHQRGVQEKPSCVGKKFNCTKISDESYIAGNAIVTCV